MQCDRPPIVFVSNKNVRRRSASLLTFKKLPIARPKRKKIIRVDGSIYLLKQKIRASRIKKPAEAGFFDAVARQVLESYTIIRSSTSSYGVTISISTQIGGCLVVRENELLGFLKCSTEDISRPRCRDHGITIMMPCRRIHQEPHRPQAP